MEKTIKMISEHYFSEDFRRIPAKVTFRTETEITPDEAAQWLDFFESCVQNGILKKRENNKEIQFVQQNDYAHKIIHTFLKAKGGETL